MNFSIGPPSARSAARNSLSGTPPTKRDQTGSPHQRSFSFDVANTTDGPLAKKQQQSSEADRRNIPACTYHIQLFIQHVHPLNVSYVHRYVLPELFTEPEPSHSGVALV